jgi:gas vesicle protein
MKPGFLAGIGVGVFLGLIFARQSGKDTRDAIRRKAQEGLDDAADLAAKVGDRVREAAAEGKAQVAEAVEAGKEAYRSQVAKG